MEINRSYFVQAGKKGGKISADKRNAKRHEVIDGLRKFFTKQALDELLKSRWPTKHLQGLLDYAAQIKK